MENIEKRWRTMNISFPLDTLYGRKMRGAKNNFGDKSGSDVINEFPSTEICLNWSFDIFCTML